MRGIINDEADGGFIGLSVNILGLRNETNRYYVTVYNLDGSERIRGTIRQEWVDITETINRNLILVLKRW